LRVFWNGGRESFRTNASALKEQFTQNPMALLVRPLQVLRMYVSRDSDERLYYAYTQLARGHAVAEAEVADRRAVTVDELRIRPGNEARFPHRDFSVEYPPLVWAAILPPAWLSDSLATYRLAFGLWMALATLGTVLLAWRLQRRLAPDAHFSDTAKMAFFLLFALGPILVVRFDIVPAFLTLLAVERAVSRKPLHAGLALGAGVACKIYPIFFAPVFLTVWLASGRTEGWKQWRGFVTGLTVSLAVLLLPFLIVAPVGFLTDIMGHALRPLEVEAVLGTPFLLFEGARTFHASGCINLAAPGTDQMVRLSGWLFLASFAATLPVIYRAAKLDLATGLLNGSMLVLLAFFCTTRVLSGQYLIWIVPFLLIRRSQRPIWLVLGVGSAMVLAQIWYPLLWGQIVQLRMPGLALLIARNLLLMVLFAGYWTKTVRLSRRVPAIAPAAEFAGA
jgi:hypothetical protein